jgi:hypothetical protein
LARLRSQTPESAEIIELEPESECGPEPECEPDLEREKADEVTEIPAPEPVEAVEVDPVMEDIWGAPGSKKWKKKKGKVKGAKEPDPPLPEASSWC